VETVKDSAKFSQNEETTAKPSLKSFLEI